MLVHKCIVIFFAATLYWAPISAKAYVGNDEDSESCSTHSNVVDSCEDSSSSLDSSCSGTHTSASSEMQTSCTCDGHKSATDDCASSVYKFTVKDINGKDVCLDKYQGKVLVIVNYASTCAFTEPNVHYLSKLAKNYEDKDVSVLIFPSNTFCENLGGNSAAKELAEAHSEFDVYSEVCVNGENEEPLYTYLKKAQPGTLGCNDIEWNFVKFVVDRNGHAVDRFGSADCTCEGLETSVQHYC